MRPHEVVSFPFSFLFSSKVKIALSAAMCLWLFLPAAFAQTQSQLTGTVTDNSGAVVVGAAVNAHNTETGVRYKALSNQSGVYVLPFLPPGRYELSCELAGFKKFMRSGLVLETGSIVTVDVRLEIGQVTETVVVKATSPLIESESSSVGQLIERASVANMPVESRRGASLVRLMGNVVYREEAQGEAIPRFTMAGTRQAVSAAAPPPHRQPGSFPAAMISALFLD